MDTDKRSPVKCRVVDLFAKKCLVGRDRADYVSYRQKKDGELRFERGLSAYRIRSVRSYHVIRTSSEE